MRISAKSRYAMAATTSMAQEYKSGECIKVIKLSEKLDISKIYLEQVFSLLKRADIVTSTKGAQGGYQLTKEPSLITVFDILLAVETSLFEKTGETVSVKAPNIENAMQRIVFDKIDESMKEFLTSISLADLVDEAERYIDGENYMFYI